MIQKYLYFPFTLFINAKNTFKKLQSSTNIDHEYLTLRTTNNRSTPNSELPSQTHPRSLDHHPRISKETPFNSQKIRARSYTRQKTETKKLRTVTKSSHTPSCSSSQSSFRFHPPPPPLFLLPLYE